MAKNKNAPMQENWNIASPLNPWGLCFFA